ncbi:helix-turn-helix domain-containing protein [Aminobacter sp. Piv2-1]|uniref:helix-turn-helix domain-containing protein n=1 Tax=Aminobacter sp. Piv2-1 TaxID=3031122 RepID=UPI0030B41BFB
MTEPTDKAKRDFTRRKFEWLDQVAVDADLPPAATRVAIIIANRYVNVGSAEAWPAVETLAKLLEIKSANTVRTALRAMEDRKHMLIDWSAGGKGQTNRYTPIIADAKHFKDLKGSELDTLQSRNRNPSISDVDTLQNQDAKHFKDLKGNPFEGNPLKEPADEPRGGPTARPPESLSSTFKGDSCSTSNVEDAGETRLDGASPTRRTVFRVDDELDVPGLGPCTCIDDASVNFIRVRQHSIGNEYQVEVLADGGLRVVGDEREDAAWEEDENAA